MLGHRWDVDKDKDRASLGRDGDVFEVVRKEGCKYGLVCVIST